MKAGDLIASLDEFDRQGVWLFTTTQLKIAFPQDDMNSLLKSLRRHVAAGLLTLVRKGLFANPRALSKPGDVLPALVGYLKPNDFSYVSLETRLSQIGRISQMPLNHITLMTTGKSCSFDTCYGTVEFVRTKKPVSVILDDVELDEEWNLFMANESLALRDLRRVGRNLDMVGDAE